MKTLRSAWDLLAVLAICGLVWLLNPLARWVRGE